MVDPRGEGHPMFCQTYKPPLKNAGQTPVAPPSLQITDHRNSGLDHIFVGLFFDYIFYNFFFQYANVRMGWCETLYFLYQCSVGLDYTLISKFYPPQRFTKC